MSGHPNPTNDNQFVAKDDKPVYMSGPLSTVVNFSGRPIDGVIQKKELVVKTNRLKRPLSSPGFFEAVLIGSSPDEPRTVKKKRRFGRIHIFFFSIAALALIVGGYLTYSGLNSIKISNLQAANLTTIADHVKSTTHSSGSSGLSTVKISANTLASYTVAPNMPRYIMIPKLNVDARVLSVGILTNGQIGIPQDIYDTAWYNESAEPGQPGAMLIDGHISSWTAHGVFYGLNTLKPGDTIQVERGDGTIFTYRVVRSQVYSSNNVDMKAALSSVVANQPGLNLITCAGEVIPGTSNFNERLVVFTTQVN